MKTKVEKLEVGQEWRNNEALDRGGGKVKRVVEITRKGVAVLEDIHSGRKIKVVEKKFLSRQNTKGGYSLVKP